MITYFDTYPGESIAFVVTLQSCVDRLDPCLAGKKHYQPSRLQAFQALFAGYRFFPDHGMDLEEDIACLLVENPSMQERATIAAEYKTRFLPPGRRKWAELPSVGAIIACLSSLP